MTTYSFTVTLAGLDMITHEIANDLIEAGCGDSTLDSCRGGFVLVHFDRKAASLGNAVGSAVKDIEKAGYKVARIEIEFAHGHVTPDVLLVR